MSIAATFKEAIKILGGLDILINNAGVINEVDFAKAIDVNVVSFINILFQFRIYQLCNYCIEFKKKKVTSDL